VNHPTPIAGVTEATSYMNDKVDGSQALAAYLRPLGKAKGPFIRFATYSNG